MAIIYSYPSGGTALGADRLLITRIIESVVNGNTIKDPRNYNLTVDAIAAYTINSLTSGGTTNTLPIFSGTGLANSLVRQDSGGIVYIGPEDNVRFTGNSVNAPVLIGTDLYITNIYANNSGLLRVQGDTIIGNEVTDTLVVNSVSTFNSAVDVNGGATFNDNVLIQTATDVDNLKIVSTNTSSGGAPDIVLLADVPAVTGDAHGDILFQGKNGMVPGSTNVLTYTGLFSKMFDKDNNHSSFTITTHKGNGSGAQALTAIFSAKGTNNAATGTLLINPSSVTEVASYNLEVKGDALVQDNLIVDANIGIGIANPQRELDVDGGVRIRGTLDLFQGNNNSFAGQNAGNLSNITAGTNTGFGKNSQLVNISGSANTSMGAGSLGALVTGNENTAIGINSMLLLNGGNRNVAVGADSLSAATTGNGNTAIGHNSLGNTTTTFFNTAVGEESLANITTGTTNTGIGNKAGKFTSDGTTANATGNYSVFIGDSAKAQANAQNNQIVIGYNTIGNGTHTATIGNSTTTALHVGGNNAGIVLKSPDGTAYTITVSNAGALVVS